MVELNNVNALIRIYSRMVSCSFLVLYCCANMLFPSLREALMTTCMAAAYLVLFQSYQNKQAVGITFYTFLLVGLGTLLAGAIGVSNIMMVTVRERTTEIGIRRAIGATPRAILSQIISESIVLTLVAGMSGILFAVLILQMLEMGNTEDGIVAAHFQIDFWTALFAALVIAAMGVLAGLAPAARAMSIKPVDAMRDE